MSAFIARAILWFIIAVILFDTTREFNNLFDLSLNPYFAFVPFVLVYGFQEFMIKKRTANEKAVSNSNAQESILTKVAHIGVWIIVASLFLGILIVWGGVIYKQIIK